jgi:hypothetical protein
MAELADVNNILSVIMVKMFVQYYANGESGVNEPQTPSFDPVTLRFSDGGDRKYYLNNEEYVGLGKLVSITSTASEIKASSGDLTITLSGIPDTSLREILNSRMKGASVEVFRAYFDPHTMEPITLPSGTNTSSRYKGFVNNFSIQEEFSYTQKSASNKAIITCSSTIDYLSDKINGRKTNPTSQKRWFPDDKGMDRVFVVQNTAYDFGKRR